MHKFTLALLAAFMLVPSSFVQAQVGSDSDTVPYEPLPLQEMRFPYSPPPCEFTAGFPEEPHITKRCDGGESGDECYDQVSYVATFGLSATVDIKVICNAVDQGIKDKYDKNIMIKTLEAMSSETIENQYEVNYNEDELGRFKTASVIGEITVGMSRGIYMSQMWIGDVSAMTVEAVLIGDPIEAADAMYRDILRSIQYKEEPEDGADVEVEAGVEPETEAESVEDAPLPAE